MRCLRLYPNAEVLLLAETSLEAIIATLEVQKPDLAIIDSVQTISSEEVNGVIGGVSQVSFVTNSLMRIAKKHHIAMFIIGHVTKEGLLAGPKTMEHMVDTVLYLEGERFMSLRILRSSKNRFGSVGEIGVFEMAESGLVEVKNPSLRFLDQRQENLPGSCIAPVVEGNKVLLVRNPGQGSGGILAIQGDRRAVCRGWSPGLGGERWSVGWWDIHKASL
jgi:DNA repair protein RadA/Sms